MGREERCLAEAVYFEARSEPEAGQAAVAQVVINRVKSGLYPATICGVVYQNRNRYMACQFSFACEGKSLRITEPGPWARASRIADSVLKGDTYLANIGDALNYHANYVRPSWARYLQQHRRHRPPHLLQAARHRRIAGCSGWPPGAPGSSSGVLSTASREPTTLSVRGPRAFDLMMLPMSDPRMALSSIACAVTKGAKPRPQHVRSSECSSRPSSSRRPTRAKASP